MRKVIHVGLMEWIPRASSFDARSSGLETSENIPRSPRGSLRSRAHRLIFELSEGGGVKKQLERSLCLAILNNYKN